MDVDNNIIYSNSFKGEFYEHELMRLLIPFYPHMHWLFKEGLTEYYTEDQKMRGVPICEHFRRLDNFLMMHDVDLSKNWELKTGNLAEGNYLLGLVLVYVTMAKGGYELLKEGMNCGRTDEDLRKFIEEKLNIESNELDRTFKEYIHKFATDGFTPIN